MNHNVITLMQIPSFRFTNSKFNYYMKIWLKKKNTIIKFKRSEFVTERRKSMDFSIHVFLRTVLQALKILYESRYVMMSYERSLARNHIMSLQVLIQIWVQIQIWQTLIINNRQITRIQEIIFSRKIELGLGLWHCFGGLLMSFELCTRIQSDLLGKRSYFRGPNTRNDMLTLSIFIEMYKERMIHIPLLLTHIHISVKSLSVHK